MDGLTYRGLPLSRSGRVGRKQSEFAVIGLASDLGASTAGGQATGPTAVLIRSEPATKAVRDTVAACGVLYPPVRDNAHYLDLVANTVETIAWGTQCVVAIGGDDSVSYGVIDGLRRVHTDLAVLHYDAHTDMGKGDSIDHANWVSFVRRLNIPVMQWGQRVSGDVRHAEDATEMRPLVIVVDLDVIDPAYAPGVAVPYPFGCTPKELWDRIVDDTSSRGKVVGIVVTELAVGPYPSEATTHLACVLLERLMWLVHTRS